MKPERILLPINVTRCPLEVFALVDGFARTPQVTVILLHVVNLNVVTSEKRVFEELAREVRCHLDRLAGLHLPSVSTIAHVRIGEPSSEILAEAQVEKPDLIILPTYGPSCWKRLQAVWKSMNPSISPLAEKVIREATCGVLVVTAKTRFNCQKAWGRPTRAEAQGTREPCANASPPQCAWWGVNAKKSSLCGPFV